MRILIETKTDDNGEEGVSLVVSGEGSKIVHAVATTILENEDFRNLMFASVDIARLEITDSEINNIEVVEPTTMKVVKED
jgi:hypothetical protein